MKTFKTIASLLVGTVSSLLLMGCGEIDTGTETSAWEKETATIVPEEPKTEIILGDIARALLPHLEISGERRHYRKQ